MYRPDEMAMILEQAKQYTNSQRLGYTETKVINWDGDSTGKFAFQAEDSTGNTFVNVLVSKTPVNITQENVKRVACKYLADDELYELTEISVKHTTDPLQTVITNGGLTVASILYNDFEVDGLGTIPCGVYFAHYSIFFTTLFEFDEIHPIPKEYIPPLDRLILNGADGNQYALTITDGALSVAPVTT